MTKQYKIWTRGNTDYSWCTTAVHIHQLVKRQKDVKSKEKFPNQLLLRPHFSFTSPRVRRKEWETALDRRQIKSHFQTRNVSKRKFSKTKENSEMPRIHENAQNDERRNVEKKNGNERSVSCFHAASQVFKRHIDGQTNWIDICRCTCETYVGACNLGVFVCLSPRERKRERERERERKISAYTYDRH